ncbi:peptidase S41 [Antarcticibacterium arcticum]|uniref:Peptidase S41 n=1 Tax=Antarcticibacterium arcticum TaxID=2585771 RepID=A0A5B8YGW4_9FLAO|nr:S41 family peptidase [Antarcticibacterium arcticum]QED37232.1 peptidase S41 [Antarcticibacterium arcticum]
MKIYKLFFLSLLVAGFTSCSTDEDDKGELPTGPTRNLTVENFIYRGLNEIYLYKANVPQLADGFFASQAERNDFLDNYATPEDLFYEGLTASQDKFSFIVDDYIELENSFSGISTTTGMSYVLSYIAQGSDDILGYVRYVLPGTSAEAQGVKRGDIFTKVDGQKLTASNYSALLAASSFTITLAKLEGSVLTDTDVTITLTKQEYNSNPVFIAKTLDVGGQKVGYLMYNSFTADYDVQLNNAFGDFKSAGITDLILDVRYNGGGSVRTATDLASMITGQFAGQLFMKEVWNQKYQTYFEQNEPERLLNKFNTKLKTGETINSLNLGRVYILTSARSASASELVINGLDPYIDVVQIGDVTTGKFTASVTLYDSPNFGRANANTTHKYAIQPLVLKSVNSAGVSDYVNGLTPDYTLKENIRTLGVLGDPDEPLLKLALDVIQGNRVSIPQSVEEFKFMGESNMFDLDYQRMYIDELPPVIPRE